MADRQVNAGDLRHRVTLQTCTGSTVGKGGQRVPTWSNVGTYWACVTPLAGMELMNARQVKAQTSHKITIRNVGPIPPTARFLFEATGRLFNLDAVYRRDERNAYYDCHATELYGEKP
jgi:SPP1 family predicted phage head-tail adaptor